MRFTPPFRMRPITAWVWFICDNWNNPAALYQFNITKGGQK